MSATEFDNITTGMCQSIALFEFINFNFLPVLLIRQTYQITLQKNEKNVTVLKESNHFMDIHLASVFIIDSSTLLVYKKQRKTHY